MIAGLPMYDLPTLRWAQDAFWHLLAEALRAEGFEEVPGDLTRPDDLEAFWRAPDLLFGQTCGYPLMTKLAGQVRVLATPVYEAPGCEGHLYCSHIVARAVDEGRRLADFLGCRAVINGWDSHSGMNALRHSLAPLAEGRARCFAEVLVSGSHRGSMETVADGRADIAAIDCVTYATVAAAEPSLTERLQILTSSRRVPGLPFITHGAASDEELLRLRRALHAALAEPTGAEARQALLLAGAVDTNEDDYQAILDMEREAGALGYAELR